MLHGAAIMGVRLLGRDCPAYYRRTQACVLPDSVQTRAVQAQLKVLWVTEDSLIQQLGVATPDLDQLDPPAIPLLLIGRPALDGEFEQAAQCSTERCTVELRDE